MAPSENKEYPLQYIKGIGPKRAAVLAQKGIITLSDLIEFFPRRYVDRSNIISMDQLQPDQEITAIGRIEALGVRRLRKPVFYLVISDGKGILEAVWFNSIHFFKDLFKVGEWISLSGKVQFYRGYQITHPDYDRLGDSEIGDLLNTGKIIALYPGSEEFKKVKLGSGTFRKIYSNLFKDKLKKLVDPFPLSLKKKYVFPDRGEALLQMHLPKSQHNLDKAIERFKYEEFFYLQLMFALQKTHVKNQPDGIAFVRKSVLLEQLFAMLPFEMTKAQKRVVREIRDDMRRSEPMNRLLQGDVGSGKTLVALMAMLVAIDNGFQTAIMAPTEILAEQHYINISKILSPFNVEVNLLTGKTRQSERDILKTELQSGEPQIVIGTQALIQDTVGFSNLGLVVIDEQHRFGVMQRGALMFKGHNVDVLVMTATPIPRTLALTAYGNLDVSVLDELPANRIPVVTAWRFDNSADKIYTFIRERIAAGEQAYIVYPLVEESEKLDLKAATEAYDLLTSGPFKKLKVGLLHGRMKTQEKQEVMSLFQKNEINILVTTTVIEVGVDVANATVMLIEHAERFGLSQLHQLRGRVGRSDKKSYCILKTPHNIGEIAQQRMKIMAETNDGFIIAEKDLELRGWGDFFGTKQSGMPDFKLANPIRDREILEHARGDAFEIVQSDPQLRLPEHKGLHHQLMTKFKERMELINIS